MRTAAAAAMTSSPHAPSEPADAARPARPRAAQDLVLGLVLAALFALVYAVSFQGRYYGDGSGLVGFHLEGTGRGYYNVLFLPACRLLGALLPGLDPLRVPELLSALAGGVGVGGTYLVARGLGLALDRAFVAASLTALAPATLFFATTVEVHALHFGVVAAAAAATLYAPWGRPALALALVAGLFPFVYWSHVTGVLLGPGWVLLVAVGRARAHRPFSAGALFFGVGPLLLAALLVAMAAAGWMRTGELELGIAGVSSQAGDAFRPPRAHLMAWEGWLLPLGVLVPAAVLALVRGPRRDLLTATLLLLVVPSTVFYLVWGVAERGAYFLGTIPFLAVLAARAYPPVVAGRARLVGSLVLFAQAVLALYEVHTYDVGYRTPERVRQVREAVGDEGVLVSAEDWAVDIRHSLPGVREISIWDELARFVLAGESPEDVAEVLADGLAPMVAEDPVAVDLGYRGQADRVVVERRLPWLRAFEAALAERYATELLPHRSWPMLRVSPRE